MWDFSSSNHRPNGVGIAQTAFLWPLVPFGFRIFPLYNQIQISKYFSLNKFIKIERIGFEDKIVGNENTENFEKEKWTLIELSTEN